MVSLTALWLPILLSAVAVFVVSSLVHMVIRYHQTDYGQLRGEDEIMAAIGKHHLEEGAYMFPHAGSPGAMREPAFIEKRTRGPAGMITIMPNGMPPLGGYLAKWFVYSLVVSLFAAYLASRALPPAAQTSEVFRFTATLGFMGYGLALIPESIWFHRPWPTTIKNLVDAALYAAATGAIFCWLWPG